MKSSYKILMLLCLWGSISIQAQDERYLDQVFDEVEVTSNVVYGANYTVIALPLIGTTFLQPLLMDVYQPAGDTVATRPLAIVLHTGNFLPIQVNGGVTGEKTDSAVVEVCMRLAKMGYVAVAADYRLGWNPLAATQPERAFGLINAAYRGVQDARTCVRYFKRDFVEAGNTFRVDTGKIVMWGQGTGGYIALAAATLDDYNKIVTTEQPVGKFLTEIGGNIAPMVVEAWNGDLDGDSLVGISVGIPIPAGDTLAIPNHPGYSSEFQLSVNMGGALGDISWLDENSTSMISFHVVNDQFAPYESAILVVPTTGDPIVEVQGSRSIITKANELGLNDVFSDVPSDEYTDAAIAASAVAGHDYQEGLYPFNIPLNVIGQANGSPWNWWSIEKWDTIVHPNAGMGNIPPGVSYHFIASLSDMTMSAEKSRTYIDTIIGYFAPRAVEALGLAPDTTLSVPQLDKSQVSLLVSPNPSYGRLTLQSSPDFEMQAVRILDITGKLVLNRPLVRASQLEVDHGSLAPGAYLVEIRFEKGIVIEKVILH